MLGPALAMVYGQHTRLVVYRVCIVTVRLRCKHAGIGAMLVGAQTGRPCSSHCKKIRKQDDGTNCYSVSAPEMSREHVLKEQNTSWQ